MPVSDLQPIPPRRHTSILRRALRQMVLLTVLVLLILMFATFLVVRSLLEQRSLAQVVTLASAADTSVEDALNTARLQSALFALDPRAAALATAREPAGEIGSLLQT